MHGKRIVRVRESAITNHKRRLLRPPDGNWQWVICVYVYIQRNIPRAFSPPRDLRQLYIDLLRMRIRIRAISVFFSYTNKQTMASQEKREFDKYLKFLTFKVSTKRLLSFVA